MKPEKQQLIDDLLGHAGGREATLEAGARILRRRRHQRIISQAVASLLLMLALAGIWVERRETPPVSKSVLARAVGPVVVPQAQALTDEQLLSLFTNTPVALATLSDGKQRLFFLHPGDDRKFVTRL